METKGGLTLHDARACKEGGGEGIAALGRMEVKGIEKTYQSRISAAFERFGFLPFPTLFPRIKEDACCLHRHKKAGRALE